MPDGLSITTMCPSSNTMRKPGGRLVAAAAPSSLHGDRAGPRARGAPDRARARRRRTPCRSCTAGGPASQLWPGKRRRSAAASVAPASARGDRRTRFEARLSHERDRTRAPARRRGAAAREPPPCAMSARPPPLPPTAFATSPTILPALNLPTRSGVTIATSAILSPSTPARTMTPERSLSRSWSATSRSAFGVGHVGAGGEHAHAADVARLGRQIARRRPTPACGAASRSPSRCSRSSACSLATRAAISKLPGAQQASPVSPSSPSRRRT